MSNETEIEFTEQQIKDFRAFDKVRLGGRYNMFDPNARRATGLSPDEYSFVCKHFSALKAAASK